jgi:cytoskeletal protein CcmA (bactofilin family)
MKLFKNKEEQHSEVEVKSIDTVIGPGVLFEGTLKAEKGVCIEGTFKGTLQSKGVVLINQAGILKADVHAAYVVVHGQVVGNVLATQQLDVGPSGRIRGDVKAATVTVAKGGLLDGRCQMVPPGEVGKTAEETEEAVSLEEPAHLLSEPVVNEKPERSKPAAKSSSPAPASKEEVEQEEAQEAFDSYTLDDIIVPIDAEENSESPEEEAERIHVLSESKRKR